MISADLDHADREAVAACANGSEAALYELYQRHAAICFGLAVSMLRDQRDAQETVQEVYLDLWQQAARLDVSQSSLRSRLLLMTRSRAIERVRRDGRRTVDSLHTPDGDRAGDGPGTAAQPGLAALGPDVRDMLGALPLQEREVLALLFWGYRAPEIADAIGSPRDTIMMRARQALAELRDVLDAGSLSSGTTLAAPGGSAKTTGAPPASRRSDRSILR